MSNIILPPKRFVGLHSHSTVGSPFDALGYPDEHQAFALENGMDALALTDHGNMNGYAHAHQNYLKLQKQGRNFKFLPGVEAYYHPDLEQWREDYDAARRAREEANEAKKLAKQNKEKFEQLIEAVDEIGDEEGTTVENEAETKDASKWFNPVNRRHHLVLLAKSSKGLENLFAMVSRGYRDGFYKFPRIDRKLLKQYGEDVIVLSACIAGPFTYDTFYELKSFSKDQLNASILDDPSLMARVVSRLENTYDGLCDAVGRDNVFPEIQFNSLKEQHLANRAILALCKKTGAKPVVTADSHYCRPEFWQARELYKALGRIKFGEIDPSMLPTDITQLKCELYPKNAEQMWDAYKKCCSEWSFYDDAEVRDAIERTHDIAHQVIGDPKPDTSVKLPDYVVPAGMTATKALIEAVKKGLKAKGLANKPEYLERIKYEMGVIRDRKFEKYFLTMKSIIDVASDHVLMGPGRGSSAASLVNYVLGITLLDPLKHNDMVFSRFINRSRDELPDIDNDASDRDKVIQELSKKFGSDNVIPISNLNCLQLKSLTKDISKFYGISFQEATEAVSTVEQDVRKNIMGAADDKNLFVLTYADAIKFSPRYKAYLEKYPQVAEHIKVLYKQVRSIGRHAGGVLIADNILDRMPVISVKKELQSPWVEGVNTKHLNLYGWAKFDLLGLETLRIVELCIANILRRHEGIKNPTFQDVKKWFEEKLHPDVLDFDDQKVYENVYHKGQFVACFQFTSTGAQHFIKRFKPTCLRDISVATAIYRPGPLGAKVDKIYLEARQDPEKARKNEHPAVWKTLETTFGSLIFQDQILKLCAEVAGYTLDESEKVRKTILKQSITSKADAKAKREGQLRTDFINGCVKTSGLTEKQASDLWEKILFFCGYAFVASHAISYAVDSYYCAYLQTHYEAEWCCAYLESSSNNSDKLVEALEEVKSLGYKVEKLDINTATHHWSIVPDKPKTLMPSFLSCKGVGNTAIDEILEKRPYKSVTDLLWNEDGTWKHSKFNKKAMEALIKIGAFDSMNLVGQEDSPFSSYKQMYHVVIENQDDLKKNPKRDPGFAQRKFEEYTTLSYDVEDWTKEEKLAFGVDLLGTFDINLVVSQKKQDVLAKKGIRSIDRWDGKEIYWWVVTETAVKKTKNGKEYVLAKVIGTSNKPMKMFMWGLKDLSRVPINTAYMASEVDKSDFGFSASHWKMRKIEDDSE